MSHTPVHRLDLSQLAVQSFDTTPLPEADLVRYRPSDVIWSVCDSQQPQACDSTYAGSCASYWPNCNVSGGCPV